MDLLALGVVENVHVVKSLQINNCCVFIFSSKHLYLNMHIAPPHLCSDPECGSA